MLRSGLNAQVCAAALAATSQVDKPTCVAATNPPKCIQHQHLQLAEQPRLTPLLQSPKQWEALATNLPLLISLSQEIYEECQRMGSASTAGWGFAVAMHPCQQQQVPRLGSAGVSMIIQMEDNIVSLAERRVWGPCMKPCCATGVFPGKVPMKGGGALDDVRIGWYEAYQHFDVVVEYNMPNIENMRLSGHFDDLLPKVVYMPPLYFDEYQPQTVAAARRGHRGIGVLALMGFVSPRRHRAIQLMRNTGLEVAIASNLTASHAQGSNVDRAEDLREALSQLLLRTRILVDLRTKEAYQTVNEFRLLPALQRGVVVVSRRHR